MYDNNGVRIAWVLSLLGVAASVFVGVAIYGVAQSAIHELVALATTATGTLISIAFGLALQGIARG